MAFFFFWLLVLLAGADKPPPRGFYSLLLILALCAAVVYWRIPTYVGWSRTQKPGRLPRVALEGFVAGLIVAAPFALNGSGEPSITPESFNYVIWFTVLGLVGGLNAITLYLLNAMIARL